MPHEFCADHSVIAATLKRLEEGQDAFAVQQSKMYASVAVMESTLMGLHENKALNCASRIAALEGDTGNCKELRVGPRLKEVEELQKRAMLGTVKVVIVAFVSAAMGACAKILLVGK